jgi:hypothetical protein
MHFVLMYSSKTYKLKETLKSDFAVFLYRPKSNLSKLNF